MHTQQYRNSNPTLVEITRGDMVESFHRGAAAVVDGTGNIVASYGNIRRLIYPRSAIKPMQALVLAESGAMEHFGLSDKELALACASHSGEPVHVEIIRSWLQKINLNEQALECGAQEPTHKKSRYELVQENTPAGAVHNNCSGKHTGFLTAAVHWNHQTSGYIKISHPVQQNMIQTLQELTEEALEHRPIGIDGCGIPVVGVSLKGIALACARMASRKFNSSLRRNATEKIINAMTQYPHLIAGSGRFCTAVIEKTKGTALVKVGAEGVYSCMVLNGKGLGIALKIDDGSRRAAEVLMGALLAKHCNLPPTMIEELQPWISPLVKNVAKLEVGKMQSILQ